MRGILTNVTRLASHLVLPAFLVACMLGLAWGRALELPDAISIAIGAAVFGGATLLLERWLPHDRRWQRSHGDLVTDALHLVVSGLVVSSLPGLLAPAALSHVWPATWPLAAQVALAIAAKDLCVYGAHRALHRHLWRVHAIHHSAPRLYWLNAWRAHPLEGLVSGTAATIPIVALGAPPEVALFTWAFTAVFSMVQHANIALAPGPLDRLLATPALHRWHHAPDANVNYGGILSVWDQLFATYRPATPGPREIGGVELPSGYIDQLRAPFVRSSNTPSSA